MVKESKAKNKKNPFKYSTIAYKEDDKVWNVLDDEMLINDPAFQNAAAV